VAHNGSAFRLTTKGSGLCPALLQRRGKPAPNYIVLILGIPRRVLTGAVAILTWLSLVTDIFVDATLLASGLVTRAFLAALRLLIRDFFSIDICLSLLFFKLLTDAMYIAQQLPNSPVRND
jgi:hypothetical protein